VENESTRRKQMIITREFIKANPGTLFVYGDNVKRTGYGGQAKVARGEPNTFGIATKWMPSNSPGSYFCDDEECFKVVKDDLDRLKSELSKYKKVVMFPRIGAGLAKLPEKAPKLYNFLMQGLKRIAKRKEAVYGKTVISKVKNIKRTKLIDKLCGKYKGILPSSDEFVKEKDKEGRE
jgi:hypothetical protein